MSEVERFNAAIKEALEALQRAGMSADSAGTVEIIGRLAKQVDGLTYTNLENIEARAANREDLRRLARGQRLQGEA